MDEGLKQQARKGIFWSAIQRFSTQGLQFIITLFIARLLTPHDYGIIGMLGIFLAIASVFVDCGFTSALIRKQNRTQEDCSTVFFFNIIIAVFAYTILFFFAPLIATFYEIPQLKNVLRILGLTLIINSFYAVHATLLNAQLNFKVQTRISVISLITAGIAAISMAKYGLTYWALVYQGIISSIVSGLLYWKYSSWRPTLIFSKKSFQEMFHFGSKLLVSSLIDTIYNNIFTLVIGKVFSASTLGNYSRAESYANFPSISFTGIIQRVTYPLLCKLQGDDYELCDIYRKLLRLSAFIIFPVLMGLAAVSHSFVIITIGKQWEFCATLLRILCFSLMWYPIHAINLSLLQVKGRTDLSLRLEIIKKIIGAIILSISIPFGIITMCFSRIIFSVVCLFINTYYSRQLINFSIFKQITDILPTFLISFTMFVIVNQVHNLSDNPWIQLICGLITGSTLYLTCSYLFNKKDLNIMLNILKQRTV